MTETTEGETTGKGDCSGLLYSWSTQGLTVHLLYSLASQTGWLINDIYFSQFQSLGRARPRHRQIVLLVRFAVWLCPHLVEGPRTFSEFLSIYKSTDSMHEGSVLMTSHLPVIPLPNTITPEIRLQHRTFGETQTFALQQAQSPYTAGAKLNWHLVHWHQKPYRLCPSFARPMVLQNLSTSWEPGPWITLSKKRLCEEMRTEFEIFSRQGFDVLFFF